MGTNTSCCHPLSVSEPSRDKRGGGLWALSRTLHALPSLVMGVLEINGAVNLTILSQFPVADNF